MLFFLDDDDEKERGAVIFYEARARVEEVVGVLVPGAVEWPHARLAAELRVLAGHESIRAVLRDVAMHLDERDQERARGTLDGFRALHPLRHHRLALGDGLRVRTVLLCGALCHNRRKLQQTRERRVARFNRA